MSLLVWLPMTKDLTQQGLQTVSATNVGATLDNKGKLGKCYSFNGNGNYLLFNYGLPKTVNTWSYCCWAKLVNNSTTMCLYSQRTTTTDDQRTIFIVQGKVFYFDDGVRIQGSLNTSADLTQWNHYTFIRNGNSLKIYINGIETVSTTISSTPATVGSYTMIGASQNTNTTPSGNSLYGYLNDIRLYDHALSPKEIEILSRGLVCHYPLNDTAIEATTNLVTSITAGGQTTVSGDTVTTSGNNADTYFTLNLSESILVGTQYTISCDVSGVPSDQHWLFPLGAQTNSSLVWELKNGHNEYTFTANNIDWGTKRLFMDDTNRTFYGVTTFSHFQLEKKDHATLYAGLGGTRSGDTTVYDCSGYQYNGTVNGTITVSDDTARYSVSTYVPKAGYIQHPNALGSDTMNQEWTCCAWVKLDSTVAMQQLNDFNLGNNIVHVANSTPLLYLNSGTHDYYRYGSAAIQANVWTHIAFVFKNSTELRNVYINGELKNGSSPNNDSTPAGIPSTITVFGGNFDGYVSDYREYATALSAAQVAELYNTAVSVANNGTLMGYELVEG